MNIFERFFMRHLKRRKRLLETLGKLKEEQIKDIARQLNHHQQESDYQKEKAEHAQNNIDKEYGLVASYFQTQLNAELSAILGSNLHQYHQRKREEKRMAMVAHIELQNLIEEQQDLVKNLYHEEKRLYGAVEEIEDKIRRAEEEAEIKLYDALSVTRFKRD